MKLKKGSKEAKAFMAKLRAAKGGAKKVSAYKKPITSKKVGSTLKLTPKETRLGATENDFKKQSKSYHKDTKSHNVNIRVVSGISNLYTKDALHKEIVNTEILIKNYELAIEGNNNYLKIITSTFEKNKVKKETSYYKSKLIYYKKSFKELKKIYNKF